jgi:hypothetical protein
MSTQSKLPSGFTCDCGVTHKYPGYVYAHWRNKIVHTCDRCERKHNILMGKATLIKSSVKAKAKAIKKAA